jgi:PTH1 family peptidyl-tRNA hydrolase
MKIILGLGNPGEEYGRTRHNVGFRVVDAVAAEHGVRIARRSARCLTGEGLIGREAVVLAKPLTFMNNSGRAATALVEAYGPGPEDLVVVCDDFHLDLARLRIRRNGSSGGQKGLQSIIEALGTDEFARLRVGIGPPTGDPVEFVLDCFSEGERPLVEEVVAKAAQACRVWALEGVDACMSAFN